METYNGHVRTPADAIILFEACRLGLLPRVQRRLSEKERQSIKSGSVFVWDEREAGMRRWTDGKSWSASRVSGSFLTYREMEGKRGGNGFAQPLATTRAGKTPDSARGSDSDLEMAGDDGPDGYRYKPDGLMKQSFSITSSQGNHLHLISYYARSHPTAQGLNQPTNDPMLRTIRPQKGMYPESTVHEQQNIPAVTRSPMASSPFAQTPHMAGYARGSSHPQPHPLSYAQPGYGWPSSQMAPAPNGYSYNYGQNGLPHPPAVGNGHSPMAYGQPLRVPPSHPPMATSLDRAPPPLVDPSLSPPTAPPQSSHRPSSSANTASQYAPHQTSHAPQPSQQLLRPHNPSSTPPMSQIDPRLMAPSPLIHQQILNGQERPSTPPTISDSKQDLSETTTSQASTIPSIGALMNGSAKANADANSDQSARSGSRSPGGSSKKEAPKDIPNERLDFKEDARALRVLDRAFRT